jgi:hypothetical protein
MYKDLMLDLETLDSDPNATIISIGAVAFDREGLDTVESIQQPERIFHITVDTWEQGLHGRTMSGDTVRWWLQQSEEARMAVAKPQMNLGPALQHLKNFVKEHEILCLWGYGATFDNVIIEQAMKAYKLKPLVAYRNHRCARTVIQLANVPCPEDASLAFTSHNALADAQRQALWLQKAFHTLTGTGV